MAGRSVFITGGARGIGLATALEFAARGWGVTIADVEGAEAERQAAAHGMLGLQLDVRDRAAVDAAIAQAHAHWGGLDALVNNAGVQRHGPLEALAFADWSFVLDVNLNGAFNCLQAAGRIMLEQGHGAVVNLASVAAARGAPGRAAYAASKAAIASLTRTAAVEWAGRGVRVNAVAPGYVATDLVASFAAAGQLDMAPILARTPAGRMAEPAEIAKVIAFLASDDASYVTGQVLFADGGFEADYGVPFSPPKA